MDSNVEQLIIGSGPCSIWDAIKKEYCDSILLRIQFSFKKIKSNAFSLLKTVSMIAVILRVF